MVVHSPYSISDEDLAEAKQLVEYLRNDLFELSKRTLRAFDYIDFNLSIVKNLSFNDALKVVPEDIIFSFAIARGNTRYIQVSKIKQK